MIRSFILTFCLGFCTLTASAQKDTLVYFKNDGRQVNSRDSADYYRVLNSRKGDTIVFTEYRKNGMWVKASATGSIINPVYNAYVNLYYKNGKPAEMHDYTNGIATKTLRYYPNGTLQQTIIYKQEDGWPRERILYEADSAGNVTISKGNGRRKETGVYKSGSITEKYSMEGAFKLGAKDGIWKGADDLGITFEETYDRGKLISGNAKAANGRKYSYKYVFQYPLYKNGRRNFDNLIKEHLKHPQDTLALALQFKHWLQLSYTINEKGEAAAIRGYRADRNTEVYLDVKYGLPRWNAAMLRGIPINYPISWNSYLPDNNMNWLPAGSTANAKSPFNTGTYINGILH